MPNDAGFPQGFSTFYSPIEIAEDDPIKMTTLSNYTDDEVNNFEEVLKKQ